MNDSSSDILFGFFFAVYYRRVKGWYRGCSTYDLVVEEYYPKSVPIKVNPGIAGEGLVVRLLVGYSSNSAGGCGMI